jgi:hypothetical protein
MDMQAKKVIFCPEVAEKWDIEKAEGCEICQPAAGDLWQKQTVAIVLQIVYTLGS